MTLDQMNHKNLVEFPNLTVSKIAFYNHVCKHCVLSFKRLKKISEKRNSEVKLRRKVTALAWMSDKDMDFEKNNVFLDETGLTSTSAVLEIGLKKVNLLNLSFLPLEELRLQSLRLFLNKE